MVFVGIALGLGYATLARYDAGASGDARHYHAMVEDRELHHPNASVFRARVLVPQLARVIAVVAEGHTGTWNATAFSLLVINALFSAGTAWLLVLLARALSWRREVGVVAALLYLASFAVTNLHLAGLVDAAECFCFTALVTVLVTRRWRWMVPLAALGPLTKEAVLPLSFVFATTWAWLTRSDPSARPPWRESLVSVLAAALAFVLARRAALGSWVLPWDVASTLARPSLLSGLLATLDRSALYVFGGLLPLSLPRLLEAPRPWRLATVATLVVATAFAAWAHAPVVRLAFDLTGPLLALCGARALIEGPRPVSTGVA